MIKTKKKSICMLLKEKADCADFTKYSILYLKNKINNTGIIETMIRDEITIWYAHD